MNCQEEDREEVLQHENSDRDPPRDRVQLAPVVEDFDDNDGAAERRGYSQVKRIEGAGPQRQSQGGEHDHAEHRTSEDLRQPGEGDGAAGPEHLFQIDLQPDHVKEQDQSQLGNGGDRFVVFDEPDADRPD